MTVAHWGSEYESKTWATNTHTRDCTCPQLSLRVCANSTLGGWRHLCVVACTQLPPFSLLLTLITHSSCFNKTLCSAIGQKEKKKEKTGHRSIYNYFWGNICHLKWSKVLFFLLFFREILKKMYITQCVTHLIIQLF